MKGNGWLASDEGRGSFRGIEKSRGGLPGCRLGARPLTSHQEALRSSLAGCVVAPDEREFETGSALMRGSAWRALAARGSIFPSASAPTHTRYEACSSADDAKALHPTRPRHPLARAERSRVREQIRQRNHQINKSRAKQTHVPVL
jgi:hypothetical protein